ncbi:MAG: HNH endonuclease [Gammaproteobacteria bacterium]|nr:HNH endonuclease [Gammaproteobacteria bacterium]
MRKAAFDWLEDQQLHHGDVLPRGVLLEGFEWQGQRVPLVSPAGIFRPRVLPELPLTITTSPNGPYEDSFEDDHRLRYRYRGTDTNHRDNTGLREAMRRRTPLIYLFGLIPGRYLPIWPVFIVGDNPGGLYFTVMADARDTILDSLERGAATERAAESREARREYITAAVQVRLHQRSFRERVLKAYREQCAFCLLRHRELLDASHIIADSADGGEPTVTNGLSLCKIHHTAFDRNLIGVRRDGVILVRRDILEEQDGPMLQHGLQGLHQLRLNAPTRISDRPDPERLSKRFEDFLAAQELTSRPGHP